MTYASFATDKARKELVRKKCIAIKLQMKYNISQKGGKMYKYYEEDVFNPNNYNEINEEDFVICVINHINCYKRLYDKNMNTIFIDKETGLRYIRRKEKNETNYNKIR